MAILKNKKNDIRSEIRSKIIKMDFQKILDNEVVSNNIPALLSYSTAPLTQVHKYIDNELRENNKDLIDVIEKNTIKIISDDVIESIRAFLEIKRNKENIEHEIHILKKKINSLKEDDDLIEKCKLEIELSKKEEELRIVKEAFIREFKEGSDKSLISLELYEMFTEVQCARNEIREEIEKEIELMKAKVSMLRKISSSLDVVYDISPIIENRVNNEVIGKILIESSREQIPIVQVLLK